MEGSTFIIAALLGLLPAVIAKNKGRSFWLWYFYGFLLFIIAIIHALLIKPQVPEIDRSGEKRCGACAEWIKKEAIVCKHCGREARFVFHEGEK